MTPTIEDVQQDFKELNVYFNDLYHHGVNQVKDSGQLWIEFSDKFRAFEKLIIAASLNRQGWTRVDNGLPENLEWCNDSVLFLQKNGVIRLGTYDYEFEEWNEIGGGIYKDVTHWMPLPKKPI